MAKAKHAVAIAQEQRPGEVRNFGEISAEPASVRRMVVKLEKPAAAGRQADADLGAG